MIEAIEFDIVMTIRLLLRITLRLRLRLILIMRLKLRLKLRLRLRLIFTFILKDNFYFQSRTCRSIIFDGLYNRELNTSSVNVSIFTRLIIPFQIVEWLTTKLKKFLDKKFSTTLLSLSYRIVLVAINIVTRPIIPFKLIKDFAPLLAELR